MFLLLDAHTQMLLAPWVEDWELFTWLLQVDETVALRSYGNNQYVSARLDQTTSSLDASATNISGWESFSWKLAGFTSTATTPTTTATSSLTTTLYSEQKNAILCRTS